MKKKVSMSKSSFIREHKKLVKILRTGTLAQRRKEAASQERELTHMK
jgi:hypothetical protein